MDLSLILWFFSNGTGLLGEEHEEILTSPKSEPEEPLEVPTDEQIPTEIDTFEPPKEEPPGGQQPQEEEPQQGRFLLCCNLHMF